MHVQAPLPAHTPGPGGIVARRRAHPAGNHRRGDEVFYNKFTTSIAADNSRRHDGTRRSYHAPKHWSLASIKTARYPVCHP